MHALQECLTALSLTERMQRTSILPACRYCFEEATSFTSVSEPGSVNDSWTLIRA